MKLVEAVKILLRESKKALSFDFDDGVTRRWLLLALAASSPIAAVSFAISDFERVNPILSFFAGCVTGPLLYALPIFSFVEGIALACFIFRLLGFDLRSQEQLRVELKRQGKQPSEGLSLGLSLIFAGLLFAAGIELASYIPIVGKQIQSLNIFE